MTRRIKVLHVGKFYPPVPGGMERIVQQLCEEVDPSVESRALVTNTAARTVQDDWRGVPVTRVASLTHIGSVGVCPTFPRHLSRTDRDVTVIHEPNPLALVSDWIARQSGPLIVWFHSEVFRPRWKYRLLYRPFLRRVLQRASRIVVSSPALAENAAELRDFRNKCAVVPFGISLDRLALTPDVQQLTDVIVRDTPGRRVLFIGRLVPYKGVDVLIRAMESVNATAFVVGSGPLEGVLREEAERYGVSDRMRFLGSLPDDQVIAHLHSCDVLVLPSVTDAETFGVVQLEAMACGKPVISTALGTGVPWVNQHGKTGLVVPPGDEEALAAALNALVRDSALRRRLGAAGRERVEEQFTVEGMRARIAELYHEVLLEFTAVPAGGSIAQARPAERQRELVP
jgi:rhamnosyl/mannosyltransferase